MKKLLYGFIATMFLVTTCLAANEWRKGTGENTIIGTELGSDIDSASYQNIVAPLDRVLAGYKHGCKITYASVASITVGAGEIVCSNTDGSIRKLRRNTSATTVAWTDIDTGAEAPSTTYYLYAVADADLNTFTVEISTNATTPQGTLPAPGGATCYRRLGSFYNNSSGSGDITTISNDNSEVTSYDSGWFAVSYNTTYTKTHNLGTTKLLGITWISTSADGSNAYQLYGALDIDVNNNHHCRGGHLRNLSTTSVTLVMGDVFPALATSENPPMTQAGYARIIMLALE